MAPDRSPAEFFVARAVGLRLPPCPVRHGLRLALTCARRPALRFRWVITGLACMAACALLRWVMAGLLWPAVSLFLFFSIGPQYHAVQVLEGSDGRLEAGGGADRGRIIGDGLFFFLSITIWRVDKKNKFLGKILGTRILEPV